MPSRTTLLGLEKHATFVEKARGPLPLRWVYPHMLRELGQHCGHADIPREQLLNE